MRPVPLLSIALAIAAVACSPAAPKPMDSATMKMRSDSMNAELKATVEKAAGDFTAAAKRGDATTMAGYYTEDAVLIQPGQEDLKGRSAIEAYFKQTLADSVVDFKITTDEVFAVEGGGAEIGHAVMTVLPKKNVKAKPQDVKFKYIVLWRKDPDGVWRIARDLTAVDMPAMPMPPGRM